MSHIKSSNKTAKEDAMGKYYTVYKNDNDEIVAFGTSAQCAETLGLKDVEQFYSFVSKTRSGLRKNYVVVVDEDDDADTEDIET